MWKQWTNFILGILVAVMAFFGVTAGWTMVAGILIALIALWAGAEGASAGSRSPMHAH